MGLISGSGRSPGVGNGNPLQYCCLENPMDRGVWWATLQRERQDLMTTPPPPQFPVIGKSTGQVAYSDKGLKSF